ncbi:MAG: glycosyl hydrolase family 59, partial [Oscillospiraceae bacterium]
MSKLKRLSAVMISAAIMCVSGNTVYAENETGVNSVNIKIDGSKANTNENFLYRGQGMISCNGSSRLLLDYKEKSPESYQQILEYMYGSSGLKFTHFKIEMGSDVNTSSGTEPTTMRYADEKADVTRGAGFQIAADIKKINPDVTLDMLWWSEPRWVTDAEDVYAARYKWYKETLDAAYETYGLVFDYVSANRNERAVDFDWIIYLSKALKSEADCPYDYSKIKIVAADECGTWNIAKEMTNNEELCDAVDVIGSHYTSYADTFTKLLAENKGKEIWFSEGSSPMTYAQSVYRFDEGNSGLTGINGVLDIANRMITMVSGGYMTMYEYQPAVAAYYDGVTYCQKQLIAANTPWNGFYTLDSGYYMNLHFSQFMEKGWSYIYDACNADGKAGGDGHAIVDAKYSYVTACSTDGDYSTVITNTTADPITYGFEVSNLAKSNSEVYVWETRGPESGQSYDANYFKKVDTIVPENGKYSVTVKPYSIVTVSTVDVPDIQFNVP